MREDVRKLFYDNPDLKKARDKYFDTMKLREDFYNNDKLVREFRNKSYLAIVDDHDKRGIWIDKRKLKTSCMEGREDRGELGAFNIYLKSKGLDPYDDFHDKVFDAKYEYIKEVKKSIDKMLGMYGNRTVADYVVGISPLQPDGKRIKRDAKDIVEQTLYGLRREEEILRGLNPKYYKEEENEYYYPKSLTSKN